MSVTAPRNVPPGDLRVSDTDRDHAVSELSEHFQAGRLTADEFEERSGLALRARTGNDLAALLADLPPAPAYRTPPAAPDPVGPLATRRGPVAAIGVAALAVVTVMAVLTVALPGHRPWAGLGPVLIVLLILRRRGHGGWHHEHHHVHQDHHVYSREHNS